MQGLKEGKNNKFWLLAFRSAHLAGATWRCRRSHTDLELPDLQLERLLGLGCHLRGLSQLGGASLLQALHLLGAVPLPVVEQLAGLRLLVLEAHLSKFANTTWLELSVLPVRQ